jgi:hypothetical protein
MDVAAVLCVRDDAPYLANCLTHLIGEGIDYAVIDNDSRDGTRAILAQPRFRAHLLHLARLPFTGRFELARQLALKEELIEGLRAEWVIHLDVDEVMHSRRPDQRLLQAIAAADAVGCNVLELDEFVFLPVERDYLPEHDGWQPLRHYYHFSSPSTSGKLMRIFKTGQGFTIVRHAGHAIDGTGVRVAPERLALRHYIVRSQQHAYEKYRARRYSRRELGRDWHHDRVGHPRRAFTLPAPSALRSLRDPYDRELDRSDPKHTHYWQWR